MKLKIILIIAAVLFVVYAIVGYNIRGRTIKYQESEIARLELNNYQLMSDARQQTNLYFREKEVTGKLKRERDSLAGVLKIKPKQITKIIYIDNKIIDTVRLMVPVERLSKTEWMLRDSTKCLLYVAKLILEGDSLKSERQLFESDNRITQLFWRERSKKFLFIHFGKWKNYQKIEDNCGDPKIQTFSFIR
jgi:hypothetical protein